jgi:2-hydroxychromene-2-carboxylate isomerase
VKIDFYYSIGSRYSYLAFTQIDTLQQETGCEVEWYPVNSVQLIAQRERNPFEGKPMSGQYEWTYRELDAQRWAKLYGVPYIEPRGRVDFDSELLALACTAAKRLDKVEEYSRLLFANMFEHSFSNIDDFQIALRESETANQLNATINRAYQSGVFGVPTFIAGDELFWGNDRLILLNHYLKSISS